MQVEWPSSRAEAMRLGINRYFTGVRCVNGHVALRYTSTGSCCDCVSGKDNPARQSSRRAVKTNYARKMRQRYKYRRDECLTGQLLLPLFDD